MHYKNGREAKNGDKVVLFPAYGAPVIGILYGAVAGNDFCNGYIAPIKPGDPCPNLNECLHLDDLLAFLPRHIALQGNDCGPNLEAVPDSSKG